jgi:uncharacterized protein YjiS (DUF1127 family)
VESRSKVALQIEEALMTAISALLAARAQPRVEPRPNGRQPSRFFMPRIFVRRLPRAIGSPRAWHAALTFLRTCLRRSVGAFAAELRARRAINHLRSLDDDRLWDLGIKRKDIGHFVRFGRD